jgi:hypothetical protein
MNDNDLDRILASSGAPQPSPEEVALAKLAIFNDLKPVRPVPSVRGSALVFGGITLALIVAGVLGLGAHGWQRMNTAQAAALAGWALAGVVFASVSVGARMAPARQVRPWAEALWGAAFAAVAVSAAALMEYQPGPKMALPVCIAVVVGTALLWAAGAAALLRRAWPVTPVRFGLACGAAAGLTGFLVVQVFCPYLETAHILVSHVLPALIACALGAGLGARFAR